MKRLIYQPILALGVCALMMVSSCSKNEGNYGDGSTNPSNGGTLESRIKTLISKLPHMKSAPAGSGVMKNEGQGTVQGGWDFSDPSSGYSYSSPSGVNYASGSNTFHIASTAFGGNSGGTVVAGATSLDINYTFCFSADDQALGLDLFDMNSNFSGVSAVVGVSGDFAKLADANSNTDFSEIFKGLAFYVVYDDLAKGSYDIIDWTDAQSSSFDFDRKSFAFLFDFKNGRLYMSSKGKITVSGGSMNFSGEYLEVSGFINSNGEFDLGGKLTYKKVSGFGAMGCS